MPIKIIKLSIDCHYLDDGKICWVHGVFPNERRSSCRVRTDKILAGSVVVMRCWGYAKFHGLCWVWKTRFSVLKTSNTKIMTLIMRRIWMSWFDTDHSRWSVFYMHSAAAVYVVCLQDCTESSGQTLMILQSGLGRSICRPSISNFLAISLCSSGSQTVLRIPLTVYKLLYGFSAILVKFESWNVLQI